MDTTPPPPGRIHTPPPPLHGTRYDDWEPYSPPRRSSRVAAQRSKLSLEEQSQDLAPSKKRPAPRSARASTPVGSSKQAPPAFNLTTSPPSSPSSPQKHSAKKTGPRKQPEDRHLSSDYDSDPFVTNSMGSFGVLPTPSKTPSKRDKSRPLSAFASTARVLFHDRPATIDEVMPSPRKARKGRKHAAFTLPSFVDECDDEDNSIQIYTDFKERVPSFDEEEDNPFISRKPDENVEPGASPSSGATTKRRITKEEEEMERRARNNEGFVQVFRGKKIFTEFTNNSDDSGSEPDSPLGGSPVRRAAGTTSRRRVTRSSVKPRLLWPSEEQQRAREAAAAAQAAEEDSTDIDASVQTATPRKRVHHARAPRSMPEKAKEITPEPADQPTGDIHGNTKSTTNTSSATPAKQRFFEPVTPPPSRTTRGSAKKTHHVDFALEPTISEAGPSNASSNQQPGPRPMFGGIVTAPAKRSPFDNWRRVKAGSRSVSASSSTKREGEPLEAAPAKRTRSSARATTPSAP